VIVRAIHKRVVVVVDATRILRPSSMHLNYRHHMHEWSRRLCVLRLLPEMESMNVDSGLVPVPIDRELVLNLGSVLR
jgi:hypothetical protein